MAQVAEWELKEPFNDVRKVLESHPQIRSRSDVEDALRTMIDAMNATKRQLEIAVQKQIIENAEATLAAARASLESLDPQPLPF